MQPEETGNQAMTRHCYFAVAEGICPLHRTALVKLPDDEHPSCFACAKWWWVDPATQTVSWELTYDPHSLGPWGSVTGTG